jgi:intracellular septation protein
MNITSIFFSKTIRKFLLGSFLEFGPIVIFLLSFEYFHVYKATIILMMATIASTVITHRVQKRLPYLALYVAFLTSVFGYMTLALHAPRFIQMRDTLYDITCALTLIVGLMINIPFLKLAFHEVVPMTMRAWTKLSYVWIFFFLITAIANEYARRTMSLGHWFDFKGWVMIVSIVFGCTTLYLFYEKDEGKR